MLLRRVLRLPCLARGALECGFGRAVKLEIEGFEVKLLMAERRTEHAKNNRIRKRSLYYRRLDSKATFLLF